MNRRRIDIFVAYSPGPPGHRNTGVWAPLNAKSWTQKIDRALKPRKRARGVKPVFDPEATSNTPQRTSH